MTTAQLDIGRTAEEELVEHWRYEQLVQAGYDGTTAARLAARNDVDLHLAVDLLRNGCSLATALRILC